MMKNSDEAVERVLAGLRETEAPAGMERRILESARDIAPRRSWWRPMMPLLLMERRRWAVVAAGVVVVSSMACWTVLREQRPGRENAGSKRLMVPGRSTGSEVQLVATRTQPLAERPPVRWKGKTNERKVSGVREDGSAVASHERSMANHPAPEAPLTAEEKLLLRMAHRHDPVEMAAMNPLLWAARDAEEKAEVQKFFEPPTTGDHK